MWHFALGSVVSLAAALLEAPLTRLASNKSPTKMGNWIADIDMS